MIKRLNLHDPVFWSDPYPTYATLRREAPVVQIDPGGLLGISRFEDVAIVLKESQIFSATGWMALLNAPWLRKPFPTMNTPVAMDPPEHKAQRAVIMHAFGHKIIPRIEPAARAVCDDFAQRARSGARIDICRDIGMALPATVINHLLGFDRVSVDRLREWSNCVVMMDHGAPQHIRDKVLAAIDEVEYEVAKALEERRRQPRDDFATDLIAAEVDGVRLTQVQLVSFMFLLLMAGFESTAHLLAHSMRLLAVHPHLWARFREDPQAIDLFIEEILRYESPVHATARLAVQDTELSGIRIPKGSFVLPIIAACNRDEHRFPDPEKFDIDRPNTTNAAFGLGAHFCIGAPLARAEAKFMLEALAKTVRSVRVVGEVQWNHSIVVRGPTSLKLEFEPL